MRKEKWVALFTVIFDYKGGTYISQVTARTPEKALLRWAESIDTRPIQGLGAKGKRALLSALRDDEYSDGKPVLLSGMRNAWCVPIPMRASLVNIVKTEVH